MSKRTQRILPILLIFAGVFVAIRYLFPLFFPFLLGAGLALAAEPLTKLLCKKLPRSISTALSVTVAFGILALTLVFLGALLVRQLRLLPDIVPELEQAASTGMDTISRFLQELTYGAPGNLGNYLRQNISEFFSGGNALLDKVSGYLLSWAGTVLSHVPDSALGIGTALISSYMIAAKLPRLKKAVIAFSQRPWLSQSMDALKRLRSALGGWLLAQAKLSVITCLILGAGFWILRISHWPLWASLVALVDAFPILGTGTVLIPWSLACLIQGDPPRGIGLLGVYAVVTIVRSVMEPRLVGKQLGLDPLATLFALYAGYRFWGLAGMLLSPMVAAMAVQMLPRGEMQ